MEPIDPKIKEAWRRSIKERRVWPKTYEHVDVLADAYLHERAMREKAEFWLDHEEYICKSESGRCCTECGSKRFDERHAWTNAYWEAKVRKELEGENG